MKLCFMGNSHLAAFRLGWNTVSEDHPAAQVDFFGAMGGHLRRLKLRDRELATDDPEVARRLGVTSGGKLAIALDAYDGFLIAGVGSGVCALMQVAERHRTVGTAGAIETDHLVSDAVFDLTVKHIVETSLFRRLVGQIRRVSQKPIVVAATPYPNRGVTAAESAPWTDAEIIGPRIAPLWEEAKAAIAQEFDVRFADQPAETIQNGFFTKQAFSAGSIRLKGFDLRHQEEEFKHMNALYGATFLREIMPLFSDASSRAPAEPERAVG